MAVLSSGSSSKRGLLAAVSSSMVSQSSRRRRFSFCCLLVLLLVLLLLELITGQAEATFLLIGFACNAALSVALTVAGAQLTALGLEAPLEVVQNLCRFLERNSLPVLAARAIEPQIQALISFIRSGRLALPNGVAEFSERLNDIVQLTEDFGLDF